MPNQQIVDYINQCLAAGQTKEYIKQSLLSVGWQEWDIDETLGSAATNISLPIDFQQPRKFSIKLLVGVILGLIILAAIGGGIYWQQKFESKKQTKVKQQQAQEEVAQEQLKQQETKQSTTQEIATTQIVDCGTSVDVNTLPKITKPANGGGTITVTNYEQDKALVCFGNNLLACSKSKVVVSLVDSDNNEIKTPIVVEVKDKNNSDCVIRSDIKEYKTENGDTLYNKFIECPMPIDKIPEIGCPMGACINEGDPGSTVIGIIAAMQMSVAFGTKECITNIDSSELY